MNHPFSNDTTQLPPLALAEVCRTSLLGDKKHDKDAWKKRGLKELYSKFKRHWESWWCGEDYDQDDGQHHLAACIFHLMTLLEKDLEAEGE